MSKTYTVTSPPRGDVPAGTSILVVVVVVFDGWPDECINRSLLVEGTKKDKLSFITNDYIL